MPAAKHSIFSAASSSSLRTLFAATLSFAAVECVQLAAVEHVPAHHYHAHAAAKASALSGQIGAYELKYFDRTFSGDDASRLDRLDNFIFGAVTPLPPQARLAHILASVGAAAPAAPPASSSSSSSSSIPAVASAKNNSTPRPAAQPADQSPGHYPRVTALEGAILGQTYESQPIADRLARMETKAFGAPSHSDDLSERTDQLDRYAQVRLHVKPQAALAINPAMTDRQNGGQNGQSTPRLDNSNPFVRGLRSLANELEPNSIAARSADLPTAPYVEEDPAEVAHKKMIEQQLADANKPTVPSTHERTLSRVAWCEKQLFGQSYPEMHLLPRLHKLNAELFPHDKEKDIQLMDRIDIIVREVVLRKHPEETT